MQKSNLYTLAIYNIIHNYADKKNKLKLFPLVLTHASLFLYLCRHTPVLAHKHIYII